MTVEDAQCAAITSRISSRLTRLLIALCGVIGPVVLVASFVINPAPPITATVAELRDGNQKVKKGQAFDSSILHSERSNVIVLYRTTVKRVEESKVRCGSDVKSPKMAVTTIR